MMADDDPSGDQGLPPPDPVKYAKLLQEYAKLKQNNLMFKKAVLDEQSKCNVMELALKEKEDKIRTMAAKVERLKFNNNSLTKRVAALQEELSQKDKSGGGTWFGGSKKVIAQKDEELSVIQSELERRIQEIATLHNLVSDTEREKETTLSMLQNKMDVLKNTLQQKENQMDTDNKNYEKVKDQLLQDKLDLTKRVSQLLADSEKLSKQLSEREEETRRIIGGMQIELDSARAIIKNKIIFDDTQFQQWNVLNVSCDKASTVDKVTLAEKGMEDFQSFVSAFIDHQLALRDKLEFVNSQLPVTDSLKTVNRKLITLLPQYGDYLNGIKICFQKMVDTMKAHLKISPEAYLELLTKIEQCVNFNKGTLSCHLLRLEEESKQQSCDAKSKARNTSISETRFQVQTCLVQLLSLLKKLFSPRKSTIGSLEVLQQISSKVSTLERNFSNLSAQLHSKSNQETAENPVLKNVNDKISESISSVATTTGRLSRSLDEYIANSQRPPNAPIRGVQVQDGVSDHSQWLKGRAASYMKRLGDVPHHQSISYQQSMKNLDLLNQCQQEKQDLQERFDDTQKRIEQLQKEKATLHHDLAVSKDTVAAKQSKLASLLEELASVRKQLKRSPSEITIMSETQPEPKPQQPPKDPSSLIDWDESEVVPPSPVVEPRLLHSSSSSGSGLNLMDMDTPPLQIIEKTEDLEEDQRYRMIVMDDSGQQFDTLQFSEEDRERELELRKFYQGQIDNLTKELKELDGKMMSLASAYKGTLDNLSKTTEEKEKLQQEIRQKTTELKSVKDDTETIKNNYDQQLIVMTEHITTQNDKVAKQEDELEGLLHSKVYCGKCKRWNQVDWLLSQGQNGRRCSGGNHGSYFNYI